MKRYNAHKFVISSFAIALSTSIVAHPTQAIEQQENELDKNAQNNSSSVIKDDNDVLTKNSENTNKNDQSSDVDRSNNVSLPSNQKYLIVKLEQLSKQITRVK